MTTRTATDRMLLTAEDDYRDYMDWRRERAAGNGSAGGPLFSAAEYGDVLTALHGWRRVALASGAVAIGAAAVALPWIAALAERTPMGK